MKVSTDELTVGLFWSEMRFERPVNHTQGPLTQRHDDQSTVISPYTRFEHSSET